MREVIISGTGLAVPEHTVSNDELVAAFNDFVDMENARHADAIAKGEREPLPYSDSAFIKKASGIESRFVVDREGLLDKHIMHPVIKDRKNHELSLQAELASKAAIKAFANAEITAADIDAVICSCSSFQRSYPAMSIEIQKELGIKGFAFDMNVACSSATFAIAQAEGMIKGGLANRVLVVNPEICSSHLNFKDRDCHFIFGDAATAIIIEAKDARDKPVSGFQIVSTKLYTDFSNNIRNNASIFDRIVDPDSFINGRLFYQEGRKVFKEVSLAVSKLLKEQCESVCIQPSDFKRLWLHQANANMNRLIATKFLGYEPDSVQAPIVLNKYANTASAGSIIAFHLHQQGIEKGEFALLSSFGAGYSIGSLILKRV